MINKTLCLLDGGKELDAMCLSSFVINMPEVEFSVVLLRGFKQMLLANSIPLAERELLAPEVANQRVKA